jgi:Uma2 family endonuclease
MTATLAADLPRRRFTVDEVLRMLQDGILHDDEPVELLDGELVVVSPQGPAHAALLADLAQRLGEVYVGSGHVRPQLPLDLRPYNLPEPDLTVVAGSARDYIDHHPAAPDVWLVVEIARTSHDLDRKKASIYGAAGIPIYWLIDLSLSQVEVFSAPTSQAGYSQRLTVRSDGLVELPRSSVRWPVTTIVD